MFLTMLWRLYGYIFAFVILQILLDSWLWPIGATSLVVAARRLDVGRLGDYRALHPAHVDADSVQWLVDGTELTKGSRNLAQSQVRVCINEYQWSPFRLSVLHVTPQKVSWEFLISLTTSENWWSLLCTIFYRIVHASVHTCS